MKEKFIGYFIKEKFNSSILFRLVLWLLVIVYFGAVLFNLWIFYFSEQFLNFLAAKTEVDFMYFHYRTILFYSRHSHLFFLFMSLSELTVVLSVVFMLLRRRIGYLIFVWGEIFLVFMPIIFFSRHGIAFGDIMFAVLFLAYFGFTVFRGKNSLPQNGKRENWRKDSCHKMAREKTGEKTVATKWQEGKIGKRHLPQNGKREKLKKDTCHKMAGEKKAKLTSHYTIIYDF